MDRCNDPAIERGIKLAPLAAGHDRPGGQPHRGQHRTDHHRISREHLTQERDGRTVGLAAIGGLNRTRLDLFARVVEHRARQDIFRFGVSRDAEPGHIDAHNPHAIDLFRKQPQRHT